MKKFVSLVLALMLAVCAFAAMAEGDTSVVSVSSVTGEDLTELEVADLDLSIVPENEMPAWISDELDALAEVNFNDAFADLELPVDAQCYDAAVLLLQGYTNGDYDVVFALPTVYRAGQDVKVLIAVENDGNVTYYAQDATVVDEGNVCVHFTEPVLSLMNGAPSLMLVLATPIN